MRTCTALTSVALFFALIAPLGAQSQELSPLLEFPPHSGPFLRSIPEAQIPVTVRLFAPPDEKTLAALAHFGEVAVANGKPAVVGRVVAMRVDRAQLAALAALPQVERVSPGQAPLLLRPLNQTVAEIGAHRVWTPPPPRATNLGEGVILADHEEGWDIFHPDFFRPDGGIFDFEDTSGNGFANAGDKVDLDGDGVFESTLSLLEGCTLDNYTDLNPRCENGYQPELDWLYVDINNNGKRDFGPTYANAPAFGEPIFVGDDVDGNGRIQIGEKLIRLNTSKVMAIDVEGTVYRRGANLASYPVANFDNSHGTPAIGIAAGGWPGLRRYTGVAPAADLVLISRQTQVEAVAAAKSLGTHVIFYEWDSPYEFQDGSTDFDLAATTAATEGMVQVAAVGNLAGADHVFRLTQVGTQARTVRLSTDGYGYYLYRSAYLQIFWPGFNIMDATITAPNGDSLTAPSGMIPYAEGWLQGIFVQIWRETSVRGNTRFFIYLSNNNLPIPNRTLTFTLSAKSGQVIPEVRGIVFDDQSGWGKGVSWLDHLTDVGSALMPSTGDKIIGVAAYGGIRDLSTWGWGDIGERRGYSGMGPRIDGARVVDIAAPDDPFAPRADATSAHGDYVSFGGTSGALPHVAGVAALLKAAQPTWGHDQVAQRLMESALVDSFVGQVPNESYGMGKVRASQAILGVEAQLGAPPTLSLTLTSPAIVGRTTSVQATVTSPAGNGDACLVGWDLGYTGTLTHTPSAARVLDVAITSTEPLRVVGKAIAPSGAYARALLTIVPTEDCAVSGCGEACCQPDGLCAPCPPEPEEDLHSDDPDLDDATEGLESTEELTADNSPEFTPDADDAPDHLEGDDLGLPAGRKDDGCACHSVQRARQMPPWSLFLLCLLGAAAVLRRRRRP